jgi:hypothetical protein
MHFQENEQNKTAEEKMMPSYHEQVDAFSMDLDNLIARYQEEFDLTVETMVGCLECAKAALAQPMIIDMGTEMLDDDDGDDELESIK